MGLIASDNGGSDFKQVPQGVHMGRCFRIVDLGDQESRFDDKFTFQHKVQISWELYGEDEDGNPLTLDSGEPMTVSKRYTVSLHKKANLRRDLESWRGRPFTDQEAKGFLIADLIGAPAMINVVHDTKGERTYANISSLSPVPKAMRQHIPAAINDPVVFDVDDPDMAVFEGFYDKLKETIQNSMQWRHKHQGGAPKVGPEAAKPVASAQEYATATAGGFGDDDMDDIPFSDPYKGRWAYV